MIVLRHRMKSLVPGAVIRYSKHKAKAASKSNAAPVEVVTDVDHVGNVKRASVYGVVAKGHKVRLADGTKLSGATVTTAVAALKPGAAVAVTLRFDNGKSRVKKVKPKGKPKLAPVVPALPASPPAPPAPPAGPWWTPSSSAPLPMQWLLDGPLSVGNAVQMGLQDLTARRCRPRRSTTSTARPLRRRRWTRCTPWASTSSATSTPASTSSRARMPQVPGDLPVDLRERRLGVAGRVLARHPPHRRPRADHAGALPGCARTRASTASSPTTSTGYSNSTGFPLTAADQIAYNRALAELGPRHGSEHRAQERPGSGVTARGRLRLDAQRAVLRVRRVHQQQARARKASDSAQAGKAVWIAEYKDYGSQWASICADSLANHFNTARYQRPSTQAASPVPARW